MRFISTVRVQEDKHSLGTPGGDFDGIDILKLRLLKYRVITGSCSDRNCEGAAWHHEGVEPIYPSQVEHPELSGVERPESEAA